MHDLLVQNGELNMQLNFKSERKSLPAHWKKCEKSACIFSEFYTVLFFPSAFEAWLLLSHLLLKREMQP